MVATLSTVSAVALPSLVNVPAIRLTMAEPTTTASADWPMTFACSAVLTPKPTAIGTNMAIGTLTGLSAGVATFLEGQIDLYAFAVVAPTTVIGAHFGAHKTGLLAPETLSRVIAWVLAATGLLMLAEDLIKRWLAP